eukprot:1102153-Amphidinium_carterae.1
MLCPVVLRHHSYHAVSSDSVDLAEDVFVHEDGVSKGTPIFLFFDKGFLAAQVLSGIPASHQLGQEDEIPSKGVVAHHECIKGLLVFGCLAGLAD